MYIFYPDWIAFHLAQQQTIAAEKPNSPRQPSHSLGATTIQKGLQVNLRLGKANRTRALADLLRHHPTPLYPQGSVLHIVAAWDVELDDSAESEHQRSAEPLSKDAMAATGKYRCHRQRLTLVPATQRGQVQPVVDYFPLADIATRRTTEPFEIRSASSCIHVGLQGIGPQLGSKPMERDFLMARYGQGLIPELPSAW